MPFSGKSWRPKTILRFIGNRPTGASIVIVDTDCGEGYLKGLGNEAGPHALACELVGSLLADWLGLPTFDFALVEVDPEDELKLAKGGLVKPGPAFISRRADGFPWGGDGASLNRLVNKEDITRLVILDTWILNCDRYSQQEGKTRVNRDNVFLTPVDQGGSLRLLAIDHTHAFTCGSDLSRVIGNISRIRNDQRFGMFPEFLQHWHLIVAGQTLAKLATFDAKTALSFVSRAPAAWQVDATVRTAWADFLVERARWLAGRNVSDWPAGE